MYTKTVTMQESKDLSTNLVDGYGNIEYDRAASRSRRAKRRVHVIFAGALGVLLLCGLLVLTALREMELAALRRDVAAMSADVVVLRAAVKAVERRAGDRDLFKSVRMFEDAIYADIDAESELTAEGGSTGKEKGVQDSLEKLESLTVLEDEDDDESMYTDDEEDSTSGDYYMDYDKRKATNGKTNMVHLKPEDFTGAIVTAQDDDKPPSKLHELRRMMMQRSQDSEVADDTKPPVQHSRSRRSVSPAADAVDAFNAPRTIFKTDDSFRQKTKKYHLKQNDVQTANLVAVHPSMRTTRNTEEDGSRRRPFVAAHFHGNTSHLVMGVHEHYRGNGLVHTPHDSVHNVWYPSAWTSSSPHPRPTLSGRGRVHVHDTGVYLVYVQVYYLDIHDTVGWVLHRTNPEAEERDALLQCTHASPSSERLEKPNSCFSTAAIYLRAGDVLVVRNTGGDRHAIMHPEKSFIGLVKLADAEDPDEQL